jgi:mannose-1-phosphate guanylyltransferase
VKAIILAAGNGERLKPLSDTVPKCLLPIRGVPIIKIWLRLCAANRLTNVLVNTHAHANMVHRYIKAHCDGFRLRLSYEDRLLGSAGTLRANRKWIGSDGDFWIFYGDVLTNVRLKEMLAFHRRQKVIATLGVCEVNNPAQCGVVSIDDRSMVKEFAEKPAMPLGNLAFSGIMIGTPALLDEIPEQVPADLGFHVLPKLVGRMAAYRISEYLLDIGTPTTYQQAQLSWPGLDATA